MRHVHGLAAAWLCSAAPPQLALLQGAFHKLPLPIQAALDVANIFFSGPACPLSRGAFLSKSFLAIGNKKGVWFYEKKTEKTTTRKTTVYEG
jgi:hypothetical protein